MFLASMVQRSKIQSLKVQLAKLTVKIEAAMCNTAMSNLLSFAEDTEN